MERIQLLSMQFKFLIKMIFLFKTFQLDSDSKNTAEKKLYK